jgi:hypothetical protein
MVTELVEDARDYADHANRDDIQQSDLALAVQNHVNFLSAQPPPREVCHKLRRKCSDRYFIWFISTVLVSQVMLAVAAERNRVPLPKVSDAARVTLPLPHDRYALTQSNYQIDATAARRA